jgi:cytochrome c biogenesis protein
MGADTDRSSETGGPSELSTQPAPVTLPPLGPRGWLRWTWRQLTSMRTALFLLLLLAVAALPGSTFPQRSINSQRTAAWIDSHPSAGPVLDRLGFFDVFASPWFAAIYLLLFVSLVGCVLPRSGQHWKEMRSAPPRAPRRLERLAAHDAGEVAADVEATLETARAVLRSRRYTVFSHEPGTLSAEKGYLKETGNLVFHLALIGVIVGVAVGHLLGWKGDVIVPSGQTFANTLSRYDTFNPGPWVDTSALQPFTLTVDKMDATFEHDVTGRGQFGMPRSFTAYTTFTAHPGATPEKRTIEVNHPLETGAGTVFLLGNGYAPKITVRDGQGTVLYSDATPFLPQDNNYKSVGAIKVAGATPKQLGFAGLFLPTGVITASGPTSAFPDSLDPALALTVYEGTLFPDARPQSVYTLDTAQMTQLTNAAGTDALRIWIKPGQTVQLPGGRGSITFDGVERFAGLSIRNDPGKGLTLVSALLALAGLVGSLVVRRRRVFVRVTSGAGEGRTVVTIGGLAKDDDQAMPDTVTALLSDMKDRLSR